MLIKPLMRLKGLKKVFLATVFLPLVITNSNSTYVETHVTNEVSGENASVHTEIDNKVNDKSVHVETTGPGEIKVTIDNDEVDIQSGSITPIVTIKTEVENSNSEETKIPQNEKYEKADEEVKTNIIISILKKILYNIRTILKF